MLSRLVITFLAALSCTAAAAVAVDCGSLASPVLLDSATALYPSFASFSLSSSLAGVISLHVNEADESLGKVLVYADDANTSGDDDSIVVIDSFIDPITHQWIVNISASIPTTTTTTTIISTTTTLSTTAVNAAGESSSSASNNLQLLLIVFGILICLLCLVVLLVFMIRVGRRRRLHRALGESSSIALGSRRHSGSSRYYNRSRRQSSSRHSSTTHSSIFLITITLTFLFVSSSNVELQSSAACYRIEVQLPFAFKPAAADLHFDYDASITSLDAPCYDGEDNDDDWLVDYPYDVDCRAPFDSSESTTELTEMTFQLREDGLIEELNHSTTTRVIVAERGLHGSAFVDSFLHSDSRVGNVGPLAVWRINNGESIVTNQEISSRVVYQNASEGVFELEEHAAGANVTIRDRVRLHSASDTIYVSIKLSNENDYALDWFEFPIQFGSLVIGNQSWPDFTLQLPASRLWRFSPQRGGHRLSGAFVAAGSSVHFPRSINSFSPIDCLGEDEDFGESKIFCVQFLSMPSFALPETIEFIARPRQQFSPRLQALIRIRRLPPHSTRELQVALGVARQSRGDDYVRHALAAYHRSFDFYYRPRHPLYCPPRSPFMYFVTTNYRHGQPWAGGYNPELLQFGYGNSTIALAPMLVDSVDASKTFNWLRSNGVHLFGVWTTAIHSSFLMLNGSSEFNGEITLLKVELDVARNISLLKQLSLDYQQSDIDMFFFARPCQSINGSYSIDEQTGEVIYERGLVRESNLTTGTDDYTHHMGMLDTLIEEAGVRGFYFDLHRCEGDESFLDNVRGRWPWLFIVVEGLRDRTSLRFAQIPIVKQQNIYSADCLTLANWLTPASSIYGGAINNNLNDNEFLHFLEQKNGTIGILKNSPSCSSSQAQREMRCLLGRRSYDHLHQLWQQASPLLACPEPMTGDQLTCEFINSCP